MEEMEFSTDTEEVVSEMLSRRRFTAREKAERSIIKKFRKEIWRRFVRAVNDYDLIQEGDRIAVCVSGGKDSFLLAKCFQELQRHGKIPFELLFLSMDPGYNAENRQLILDNAELLGIPLTMFESDIFAVVDTVADSPCYLCARMRRGYLYKNAQAHGCNKIALGHHFDDIIETILMSMIYGGEIRTMMPKLHSTNFEGMELIRPMELIREADIIAWVRYNELNFIQCACRVTEKTAEQGGGSKRNEMKQLVKQFRAINPYIETNIFRSVQNVNIDAVVGYKRGDGTRSFFLDQYDEYPYRYGDGVDE